MKFINSKNLILYLHTLFLCFIALYSLSCKQTRRLNQNHDQNPHFSETTEEISRPQTHLTIRILDPQKTSFLKLTPQEEAEHLLDESSYQFKLNVIVDDSDSAEETTIYLKSLPVYSLDEEAFSLGASKISPLPIKTPKAGKPHLESPRIKNFKIEHGREIFAPSSVARDHMFPSTQTKQDYELGGEVIGKLEDGSLIKINLEQSTLSQKQVLDVAERELAIIAKNLDLYKKSIRKPMQFSDSISDEYLAIPSSVKQLRDTYFSKNPSREIMKDINSAKLELRDELKLFSESTDLNRIAPIYALVRKLYKENFGVDDYTWKTDGENQFGRGHYFEVANGLKKPISVRKAVAAFMHDLERFFPSAKVSYLSTDQLTMMGGKTLDGTLRKKALHPRNSAKLADLILKNNDLLSTKEKSDIFDLILYHDASEKA